MEASAGGAMNAMTGADIRGAALRGCPVAAKPPSGGQSPPGAAQIRSAQSCCQPTSGGHAVGASGQFSGGQPDDLFHLLLITVPSAAALAAGSLSGTHQMKAIMTSRRSGEPVMARKILSPISVQIKSLADVRGAAADAGR